MIIGNFDTSPLSRLAPSGIKPRPAATAKEADVSDTVSIGSSAAEAESKPSRLNLVGQFRLGLCLALTLVGAASGIVASTSEASPKQELQAQVQVKAPGNELVASDLSNAIEQGWLLAGQTKADPPKSVVVEVPPAFQPSTPVAQKGDYVAHGVNFSQLLTDAEFTNTTAATAQDIQQFLESKNSFLADFKVDSLQASQVLIRVANEEHINPWLLVTTMEKENSMVSRQSQPRKHVMNSAMGFGHTDGGNLAGRDNNFENQIRRGASLLRELYDEGQQQAFPHKMKVDFGKRSIKVRNAATYALMRYTPHTVDTSLGKVGGGNYLFRHILQNFTQDAQTLQQLKPAAMVAQAD